MQVRVFVTDDGSPQGTGPMVFVQEGLDALPANPRLMPWRYFATISDRDPLFAVHGQNAADALLIRGHLMLSHLDLGVAGIEATEATEPDKDDAVVRLGDRRLGSYWEVSRQGRRAWNR